MMLLVMGGEFCDILIVMMAAVDTRPPFASEALMVTSDSLKPSRAQFDSATGHDVDM